MTVNLMSIAGPTDQKTLQQGFRILVVPFLPPNTEKVYNYHLIFHMESDSSEY